MSDNNGVGKRVGADPCEEREPDEFDGSIAAQRDGPEPITRDSGPGTTRAPDTHDGRGDARLEAEGELAMARLAMNARDPARAATHVAAALAADPTLPDAYDMLRELDAPPMRARDYFPLSDAAELGVIAARSYLAARAGYVNDALSLLVMVAASQPTTAWTSPGWLDLPGTAEQADAADAAETLLYLALRLDEPVDAALLPTLGPYLDFARRLVEANPGRADVLAPLSGLARRLGAVDEAVAWCEVAEGIAPSPRTAIMLGYAYRAVDRTDDMVAIWEMAVIRDPSNVDIYVDLADHLDRANRPADALAWLDRALGIDPTHHKAVPFAYELRFRTTGSVDHLVALADHCRAHPDRAYPVERLAKACEGRLWLRIVPPTIGAHADPVGDATPSYAAVKALSDVAAQIWAHPLDAYDRAAALADLTEADFTNLLAHVPLPPTVSWRAVAGTDPDYWPSHARAWVCLGMVRHGADETWPSSWRRRVLVDLATADDAVAQAIPGARDAALFALAIAAWLDPTARADAARVAGERFAAARRALRTGAVPNAVSLAVLATITPGVAPSIRRDARLLLAIADNVDDVAALEAAVRREFGRPWRAWIHRRLRRAPRM
ncbi:MAG TPA: tetratricopeptide repeat protein [Micromonosporaceae bacterium]